MDVPDEIAGLDLEINVHLHNAPDDLNEHNIEQLGEYYISYLTQLIKEAKQHF